MIVIIFLKMGIYCIKQYILLVIPEATVIVESNITQNKNDR